MFSNIGKNGIKITDKKMTIIEAMAHTIDSLPLGILSRVATNHGILSVLSGMRWIIKNEVEIASAYNIKII
jgi:hypothetical protein